MPSGLGRGVPSDAGFDQGQVVARIPHDAMDHAEDVPDLDGIGLVLDEQLACDLASLVVVGRFFKKARNESAVRGERTESIVRHELPPTRPINYHKPVYKAAASDIS